ncbi:YHS domain-containing (seleno)protein [Planctobacterium marinum]|uniref:YHS domain-containing protein n=1 Tax=Planctobacterium marinum TaxID=1631968 RepID=A0AA48I3E4_9ALTE|nr:hypothetical protein MACH26_07110 [Planctobacterium marinum]
MKQLLATLFILILSFNVFAGIDTETDENGVILAGHDAVAYFTENKPVLGMAEITALYQGAIYRFSSAQNRDLFNANPAKYAPAYGGYCSTGTSFGKKFEVNGKAFKIVDGQLYVNKDETVHEYWLKDVAGNIVKADDFWPEIKDVPAGDL